MWYNADLTLLPESTVLPISLGAPPLLVVELLGEDIPAEPARHYLVGGVGVEGEVGGEVGVVHDHKDAMRSEEHGQLKRERELVAHVGWYGVRQEREHHQPNEPEPENGAKVPIEAPLFRGELLHCSVDGVNEPDGGKYPPAPQEFPWVSLR